jgi:site-specific DNA-methyltransferase (adenine-specific)
MIQQKMGKEKELRIHPTQKPVDLYKWLLKEFATKGDKILDTHLGSASIALACWDMRFDLTGYEIDKEYYDKACKRFKEHSRQMQLW